MHSVDGAMHHNWLCSMQHMYTKHILCLQIQNGRTLDMSELLFYMSSILMLSRLGSLKLSGFIYQLSLNFEFGPLIATNCWTHLHSKLCLRRTRPLGWCHPTRNDAGIRNLTVGNLKFTETSGNSSTQQEYGICTSTWRHAQHTFWNF